MASTVNRVTAQVQVLPVATVLRDGRRNTAVTVLRVVSDQVVGTAGPNGRAGILNVELERVHNAVSNVQLQRGFPLPLNVRSIGALQRGQTESALIIQLGKVTGGVNRRIIGSGGNTVDRAVEVRAPIPVHRTVRELNTSRTTRVSVRLRRIALHDLGELATNRQAVIRQGLKRLNRTVEGRAEGTNQLARIHVVTGQEGLVHALATGRLDVLEVAAGEDRIAHLGDGLNVGVHLVLLAGTGLLARTPTHGHRVAIGQGATVACRGTRTDRGEVQVVLRQLRAQEHLGEGDGVTGRTALLVDVRIRVFATEVHPGTVGETNLVTLVRVREELHGAGRDARRHLRGEKTHVGGAVNTRAREAHGTPALGVAHGPGPLIRLGALNVHVLPLGALRVVRTVQAHAVGEVLRLNTVQQGIHGGARELDRGERGRSGRVLVQLVRVARAVVGLGPALSAAANHDPAAAVGLLIAVELRGTAHGRGVQPVGARRGRGVDLLDLVT